MSTVARASDRGPRPGRVLGRLMLVTALTVLGLAALHGVRFLPVLTGSMTPYAPAGSLVLAVPVSGSDVVVGDVVVFRPPAPYTVTGDHPILHRVAELGTADGLPYMGTRGDANATADPWRVGTQGAEFGRAVAVLPHVGHLLSGGTGTALAYVLGGAALLAGLRGARRGPTGRHRARRGRRTIHREPGRCTATVTVDVPREQWSGADAQDLARARARAALEQGLSSAGFVLRGEPVGVEEPAPEGGCRLLLTAAAAPGAAPPA